MTSEEFDLFDNILPVSRKEFRGLVAAVLKLVDETEKIEKKLIKLEKIVDDHVKGPLRKID